MKRLKYTVSIEEKQTDPGTEYSAFSWNPIFDTDINSLFKAGVNVDDRQFWPIWQVFIDGSNGKLFNDYGY